MARAAKGPFHPQNPSKYTGDYPIIFRSSWEREFMNYCDNHPEVLEWASEPHKIPYKNPLKAEPNNQTVYIPDFLVTYLTKGGNKSTKLIEIKPMHEAAAAHARTNKDAMERMRNEAKWGAAAQWAERRGIDFIVLTEAELYSNHANRKGRKHPIKARAPEQVKSTSPKGPARVKKQTAANLGTASRKTRASSKSRISSVMSRKTRKVGKVRTK